MTAVHCAKFQDDFTTEMDVMRKKIFVEILFLSQIDDILDCYEPMLVFALQEIPQKLI